MSDIDNCILCWDLAVILALDMFVEKYEILCCLPTYMHNCWICWDHFGERLENLFPF